MASKETFRTGKAFGNPLHLDGAFYPPTGMKRPEFMRVVKGPLPVEVVPPDKQLIDPCVPVETAKEAVAAAQASGVAPQIPLSERAPVTSNSLNMQPPSSLDPAPADTATGLEGSNGLPWWALVLIGVGIGYVLKD